MSSRGKVWLGGDRRGAGVWAVNVPMVRNWGVNPVGGYW
jgi:hypothetical protein